jgi:proline racemase
MIKSIDAHVGGQPLRLIVDGAPRVLGKTLAQKQAWLKKHADDLRRAVILEPRGHVDMTAALFVEPTFPGAHAGLIFMDADGYPSMSGHGVIAAATIAIEHGLLFSHADLRALSDVEGKAGDLRLVFETAAGSIQAHARVDDRGGAPRVHSVAFTNVPAFVHAAGRVVTLGTRELRVDIAFGGLFYAIADTEAIGIPVEAARLPELRRLARQILQAVNVAPIVTHPVDATLFGMSGVIFTAGPHDPEAHLRNVVVTAAGAVDRSAGGAATSALMAVLEAMGLLPEDQPFVHEGLAGTLLRGRAVRRTLVGDSPAVVTEIEGTAWVTGEHSFHLHDDDPFRDGFSL